MKIAALEDFLSDSNLAGSSSFQVLQKFLLYAKLVKDPFNVFRYMEEKSICIYFPLFWFTKSEYFAEIGDYRNAFLCLKQAQDRKSIQQNDEIEKLLNTEFKAKIYREQISSEMMKYPPNKRRTISDFTVMTSKFEQIPGDQEEKNEKLFDLLESKFPILRADKQRKFQQKNSDKPQSWLYENYRRQEMKINQVITETFKHFLPQESNQQSIFQSKNSKNPPKEHEDRLFKSLNTPFKKRDPMKMSKTVDSVQMMKRKKRSPDPQNRQNQYNSVEQGFEQQYDEEDDQNIFEDSYSMRMNTVPVGRAFENKKRLVKFQKDQFSFRIQKPRGKTHSQGQVSEDQKETFTQRRSILKNKSNPKSNKPKKQTQFPIFSDIGKKSLQIKQTQENDI